MTKLLLLGEPLGLIPVHYRGTDRATPTYCVELPAEHPANQAFFWYTNESYPDGAVYDRIAAERLIHTYASLESPQCFELIEAVQGQETPTLGQEQLGYDVVHQYHYSLLSWGLVLVGEPAPSLPDDDRYWQLVPLLRLIQQFFQPRLNQHGLFDDPETAQFFLDCMLATQAVRPALWEHEEVKFQVVGLWKV